MTFAKAGSLLAALNVKSQVELALTQSKLIDLPIGRIFNY